MKIIALDSSGMVASAALLKDEIVVAEYTVNFKRTHSQTLLPMLDTIVAMTEWELKDTDAIAVAAGPGSFTGLRIGSATAKGLGLALDLPVIGVPTTDALAYNLWGAKGIVCPLMDARRNQTYTGLYTFAGDTFSVLREACAVDISEIVSDINARGEHVAFLGDGVPVFEAYIKDNCRVPYVFAPAHMNRQRAASVGALAFIYAKEGRMESADMHRPDYLRLSQAERERMEKEKAKEKTPGGEVR